jgi:hypothetical protein
MRGASRLTAGVALAAALTGCDAGPAVADASPVDSLQQRPGYVVDSIFPMEEMLRRFRADLGDPPVALVHGADSRDALVRQVVSALAERDSATLDRLRIDRAEFAWLYFPASPFATPPYELPPEVLWLQIGAESGKGLSRALRAGRGGASYLDHECDAAPRRSGAVVLWERCAVGWRNPDGTEERYRLFGSVLEHGGRFKLVSYANPL